MGILRSASCTYTIPMVVRKNASTYTARLLLFSVLACRVNGDSLLVGCAKSDM